MKTSVKVGISIETPTSTEISGNGMTTTGMEAITDITVEDLEVRLK